MTVSSVFIFFIVQCLLSFCKFSEGSYNVSISLNNSSFVQYSSKNAGNLTFDWTNSSVENMTNFLRTNRIDCFGLGSAAGQALHWLFGGNCKNCETLDVRFYLTSRKQPHRVEVMVGNQFGLEWTDFRIERRTVLIVHGFLADSDEAWVKNMEQAFLLWGDVNVIVVDWGAGGHTWNYYKAVVYSQTVGHRITRFLGQMMNATLDTGNRDTDNWGPLHFVGHSLGAHICGFVSYNMKRMHSKWLIKRITGLDPAHPCFTTKDQTLQLDKTDAPYVDVIHTNGRRLSLLGLGLPTPIGHADFYPNGGMKQPGCFKGNSSFSNFLPISTSKIDETICSHSRSIIYFTESLIAAVSFNCTFWAHHWDMTYRGAFRALRQPCTQSNCSEMGIRSEAYPHRGTFYVATADQSPFCVGDTVIENSQLTDYFVEDHSEELED